MRPYLKNTHHKKGLVEWLKVKTPSSSPSTTKKRKRKEKSFYLAHGSGDWEVHTWQGLLCHHVGVVSGPCGKTHETARLTF
jgi:hypothetical protein